MGTCVHLFVICVHFALEYNLKVSLLLATDSSSQGYRDVNLKSVNHPIVYGTVYYKEYNYFETVTKLSP